MTGTPTRRRDPWLVIAAFVAALAIQLTLLIVGPSDVGAGILLAAVGAGVVLTGLASPVLAVLLFLLAAFLRLALPMSFLPVDPFLFAFAGVCGSAAIGIARRVNRLPRLGAVEAVMLLYLVWNIGSAIVPHTYPATVPLTGEEVAVWRFIVTSTVIPFICYGIGRFVFERESALRRLLWFVLGLAAYSALISVMQFHGPTALVWPRFIVEEPSWEARAVGVLDQPVVNGLILIVGFVVALHLAHQSPAHPWRRVAAFTVAAVAMYAIYLTYTRVVWLAFGLVLVAGAVSAQRFRGGFLSAIGAAVLAIGINWSDFTSADRESGGVASVGEVEDRLNSIATSIWAVLEKPFAGWGIGRFAQVNTYHHQQWSPDVEWSRGYGIASHLNELGITVELGLVGLGLWLAVLGLVLHRLVTAVRHLSDGGPARGLALVALFSFCTLVVSGATVDLRFFIYPTALVMLLAGIAVGYSDRAVATRRRTDQADDRGVQAPSPAAAPPVPSR